MLSKSQKLVWNTSAIALGIIVILTAVILYLGLEANQYVIYFYLVCGVLISMCFCYVLKTKHLLVKKV